MWRLVVLLCVLAAPASAQAAVRAVAMGDGVVGDVRAAFPPGDGAPAEGKSRLERTACASGVLNDDTLNEGDRGAAKIRAIEVVPSDRAPDPAVRDAIASAVAEIAAQIERESGGRRSLRFDVGTRCGPSHVDVHSILLPRRAAEYRDSCDLRIFEEVRAALPPAPGPRNAILFSSTFDCGLILGFADSPRDDRPGPDNAANRGGYLAISFELRARTALHEIGHTLGAVQRSAPHSDTQAHCYDNDDTMCYGYTAALPTRTPLLRPCVADPHPFDCGQDDYFSPAPAPGSYLATHWNTYDSIFMCDAAACVPPPPAPPAAPSRAGPAPSTPRARQPSPRRETSKSKARKRKKAKRCTRRARRCKRGSKRR